MESAQPGSGPTHQSASSRSPDRKRLAAFGVLALAAIWLVAFVFTNTETIRVSLVFGHVRLSLIWVMIICAVLGAVLAFGIGRLRRRG